MDESNPYHSLVSVAATSPASVTKRRPKSWWWFALGMFVQAALIMGTLIWFGPTPYEGEGLLLYGSFVLILIGIYALISLVATIIPRSFRLLAFHRQYPGRIARLMGGLSLAWILPLMYLLRLFFWYVLPEPYKSEFLLAVLLILLMQSVGFIAVETEAALARFFNL